MIQEASNNSSFGNETRSIGMDALHPAETFGDSVEEMVQSI